MGIICLSPLGHLIIDSNNLEQYHFLKLSIISLVFVVILLVYTYCYAKYSRQLEDKFQLKMKKVILNNGKSIEIPKNWTLSENDGKSYIYNDDNRVAIFQSKNTINPHDIFTITKGEMKSNELCESFKSFEILSVEKISDISFMGKAEVLIKNKNKCMNYFLLDDMQFFATDKVSDELLMDIVLSYE